MTERKSVIETEIEKLLLESVNKDLDEGAVQRLENKVKTIRELAQPSE